MHCPACNHANESAATACAACQAPMEPPKPKRARRRPDPNAQESPEVQAFNLRVKKVFHLCLWATVPFFGLVLGPIGAARARGLLAEKFDPANTSVRAAQWAFKLGVFNAVTQYIGVGLMAWGWWG